MQALQDWHLPYLTADLPGVGGVIRAEIEDFIVDEVPAYEPSGEGEHTYVRVEKRDLSTPLLLKQLAQRLNVDRHVISCAGLKDARAIARQTLSLHGVPPEALEGLELDNARILWVSRHRNKLRTGHLRGNYFAIRIRQVCEDAPARATPILKMLAARGVPNGYGRQRFGNRGDNHLIGLHLVRGDREALADHGIRHPSWRLRRFFVSALQSALFNRHLTERMHASTMDDLLLGDVARKEDTGGIFTVEEVAVERPRVANWEISPTGPIYGYKMMEAQQEAGTWEAEILAEAGLSLEDFRAVKAPGTRRPLRYRPEDLTWQMEEGALVVSFFAPKGSYATMLLRELMKVPEDESWQEEEGE